MLLTKKHTIKNKTAVYYLPSSSMNSYPSYRQSKRYLAIKRNRQLDAIKSTITTLVIAVIAIIAMVYIFGRAIDIHISNQDTMLCNSARVSGNVEYLNKCKCYYSGLDIACINE